MINGRQLNASMFLNLALEYIESFNSKESPIILAAIDRVIQSETVKILDHTFDFCKQEAQQIFSEDSLPMNGKDFKKAVKKLVLKHKSQLVKDLSQILSFPEIL